MTLHIGLPQVRQRADELRSELAMLDIVCRVNYHDNDETCDRFWRWDCLANTPPFGDLEIVVGYHTAECQRASRAQKSGVVFECDEHWRRYFAWKLENEATGITYPAWLDATGEVDERFWRARRVEMAVR